MPLFSKKFLKEKLNIKPFIHGEGATGHVYLQLNEHSVKHQVPLGRSLKLANHSPTGFSWGYAGSGPAQLALAILLVVLSEDEALRLYQKFKFDVISKLPMHKDFTLMTSQVYRWVENNQ